MHQCCSMLLPFIIILTLNNEYVWSKTCYLSVRNFTPWPYPHLSFWPHPLFYFWSLHVLYFIILMTLLPFIQCWNLSPMLAFLLFSSFFAILCEKFSRCFLHRLFDLKLSVLMLYFIATEFLIQIQKYILWVFKMSFFSYRPYFNLHFSFSISVSDKFILWLFTANNNKAESHPEFFLSPTP